MQIVGRCQKGSGQRANGQATQSQATIRNSSLSGNNAGRRQHLTGPKHGLAKGLLVFISLRLFGRRRHFFLRARPRRPKARAGSGI